MSWSGGSSDNPPEFEQWVMLQEKPVTDLNRGIRRTNAVVNCIQIHICIHPFVPTWGALR